MPARWQSWYTRPITSTSFIAKATRFIAGALCVIAIVVLIAASRPTTRAARVTPSDRPVVMMSFLDSIINGVKEFFSPPKIDQRPAAPSQRASPPPAAPTAPAKRAGSPGSFSDVWTTDRAFEAVEDAKTRGLLHGYEDGTFRPDQPVNRAEFVHLVVSAYLANDRASCPRSGATAFSDTDGHAWYAASLCVLAHRSIIAGYPKGGFRPGQTVSGAEAAKMLVMTLRLPIPDPADAGEAWHAPYWSALLEAGAAPAGVTPSTALTRADVVMMLHALRDRRAPRLLSSSSSNHFSASSRAAAHLKVNARRAKERAALSGSQGSDVSSDPSAPSPRNLDNLRGVAPRRSSASSSSASAAPSSAAASSSSTSSSSTSSSSASSSTSSVATSTSATSSATSTSSSKSAVSSSSFSSPVSSSSSVASAPPSSSSAASSMSFPASDTINRPVLSQANFTYLGSFKLPTSDGGSCSTAFSPGGLTHRYVDGQLRFLTTSSVTCGNLVYETNFPGMSVTSPPTAQVVRHWGDVYTGRRWIANDGGTSQLLNGTSTYGLYYDSASSRLYWNYGHWYNADFPFNPSVGYSILDDATGVATGIGAWSLASRPEKFTRGGVLKIPQWFANRFTGGRTLGVGFGGYFSIVVSSSLGPALSAIAPPDPASALDRSALPNTPLLGYPHNAAVRAHRDADYHTSNDVGWNPQNGVGYWTWSDIIYGAASWIDLPSVQGVLFIAKIGQGRIWYESADRHAARGRFEWFVYDPKDLAAVATGAKEQWEIQPLRSWTTSTLPMPIDQNGWAGDGYNQVGGVTFDEATKRLFVLVTGSYKSGVEWHPQVHVYQVE